jgi:hypothetical protein
MKKKTFTTKLNNAVEPAAPASVWGYKGCAGKDGKTRNSVIIAKTNAKETD